MTASDALLQRLSGVRQYGNGWRADCPVGHSSRGSLSLAVGEDGRVLLRCFVGCPVNDVLGAVGLTVADLFPERQRDTSPSGRHARREAWRSAGWSAALGVLASEVHIVEIAGTELAAGRALGPDDHARLRLACCRIHDAREVLA